MGMTPEIAEYEREILAAMDVEAEWKELVGLRTVGSVGANGFLSCYSIDGESDHPCAAICINGKTRGCYTDRRPGHEGNAPPLPIFKKKAELSFGGSYWQARDFYAQKYGVKKPETKGELEFRGETTPGQRVSYCDHKHGVTPQALIDCGAKAALYPDFLEDDRQKNRVIAFPFYWADSDSLEPCGWHFVNQDPRRKIDQGSNRKQEKVLSRGRVGFLNKWAIEHWDTAEVVWLVEGISDTLAVQAIIDRSGKHVVTSSGGCGTTPWKKAIEKLTGKTVYVCFDVGDKKNEGQKGSAKWIKSLTGVAKLVKNVELPASAEGSKFDLRDWITSGNRTYADMLALAEAATTGAVAAVVAGASSSLQSNPVTPEQSILDRLGCVVVGRIQDTNFIETYSTFNRTGYTIKSINSFSIYEAILAYGGKAVNAVISQDKEPPPGKVPMGVVKQAITTLASGNIITDRDSIGAGIWEIEDDIVFVGKASAHRYTTDRRLVPIMSPMHRGRRIDFSSSIVWYEESRSLELLQAAADPAWRRRVVDDLLGLFSLWDNWTAPSSVEVGAGLVMASWVQTLWKFRPHVCIAGPSDCGKTTFIGTAMKGMFNGLYAPMQKTTEAGVRQKIRNTAMIMALDEFEGDENRKSILDLLRTSTRGEVSSPRGTASGKGQEYGLKHIVWTSGIETGLTEGADKNRFISLDLKSVDLSNTNRKKLVVPPTAYLHDLGERAAAAAVYTIREARDIAERIAATVRVEGVDTRYIEGFAVPASMLAMNYGGTVDDACENVRSWIEDREIRRDKVSDEEELIEAISNSKGPEGGKHYTIGYLLEVQRGDVAGFADHVFDTNSPVSGADADRILQSNGIRYLRDRRAVAIHPAQVRRFLLANTRFQHKDIRQLLKRVNGATQEIQKIVSKSARVIMLPEDVFI
jgi:hypothetical protein